VRRLITVVVIPLSIGLLGGCGGSGGEKSSGASVALEADNYYFKPTEISLTAGKQATIEVKNAGNVEHNLTVEGLGVTKDIEPGKSQKVPVTAAAGTYPFRCQYHPTQMMGTITAR
jgi:plastocyanin